MARVLHNTWSALFHSQNGVRTLVRECRGKLKLVCAEGQSNRSFAHLRPILPQCSRVNFFQYILLPFSSTRLFSFPPSEFSTFLNHQHIKKSLCCQLVLSCVLLLVQPLFLECVLYVPIDGGSLSTCDFYFFHDLPTSISDSKASSIASSDSMSFVLSCYIGHPITFCCFLRGAHPKVDVPHLTLHLIGRHFPPAKSSHIRILEFTQDPPPIALIPTNLNHEARSKNRKSKIFFFS